MTIAIGVVAVIIFIGLEIWAIKRWKAKKAQKQGAKTSNKKFKSFSLFKRKKDGGFYED